MIPLDALRTALIDLTCAVGERIPLVVRGGFGLYLRQEQEQRRGSRMLFEQLPEPRATNDIDLFIKMEVLVRAASIRTVRICLEQLGYAPVNNARFFQWIRQDQAGRQVKVDLLCGPLGD